jgi:hypothetical protein
MPRNKTRVLVVLRQLSDCRTIFGKLLQQYTSLDLVPALYVHVLGRTGCKLTLYGCRPLQEQLYVHVWH